MQTLPETVTTDISQSDFDAMMMATEVHSCRVVTRWDLPKRGVENRSLLTEKTQSLDFKFTIPPLQNKTQPSIKTEYDHLGRRIVKKKYSYNGSSWTQTEVIKFVYDGWRPIAEFDINDNLQKVYTWGLDITGTMDGAAGIGGLLAVTDVADSGNTYYAYDDGRGNVVGYADSSNGEEVIAIEYSPYGRILGWCTNIPKFFNIGYQSKFTDHETELVYFGLRWYSPYTRKFMSRDPLGEAGSDSTNLYAYCDNDPINKYDAIGAESKTWYEKIIHDMFAVEGDIDKLEGVWSSIKGIADSAKTVVYDWNPNKYVYDVTTGLYNARGAVADVDLMPQSLKDIGGVAGSVFNLATDQDSIVNTYATYVSPLKMSYYAFSEDHRKKVQSNTSFYNGVIADEAIDIYNNDERRNNLYGSGLFEFGLTVVTLGGSNARHLDKLKYAKHLDGLGALSKSQNSASKIIKIGDSGPYNFSSEELAKIILNDPVALKSYRQIQQAGFDVRLISKSHATDAGKTFSDGTIEIFLGSHKSTLNVVETLVHESSHVNSLLKRGTFMGRAGEHQAFAREFLFKYKRLPTMMERQRIRKKVLDLYPDLPLFPSQ